MSAALRFRRFSKKRFKEHQFYPNQNDYAKEKVYTSGKDEGGQRE
jgi:hypothetical protein